MLIEELMKDEYNAGKAEGRVEKTYIVLTNKVLELGGNQKRKLLE